MEAPFDGITAVRFSVDRFFAEMRQRRCLAMSPIPAFLCQRDTAPDSPSKNVRSSVFRSWESWVFRTP